MIFPIKKIIIALFSAVILLAYPVILQGEEKRETAEESVRIQRFDKDLYSHLTNSSKSCKKKLASRYPSLLPAFGQITVGKMIENDTTAFFHALEAYFQHPALKNIYQDELKKFEDLSACELVLAKSKGIAQQILPDNPFPVLAIHVSGFKENVIAVDGIISLSGDKYLGENYAAYQNFFNAQERANMRPDLMPRDYLKAWIMSGDLLLDEKKPTLLTEIIKEGKLLFLLKKLLPEYTTEDVSEFSTEDLNFFSNQEKEIWNTISKGNTLFSSNRQTIAHYTDNDLTIHNYPRRTGSYIGWKIVEQYVQNTNSSVQNILSTDAVTILKESKYKP